MSKNDSDIQTQNMSFPIKYLLREHKSLVLYSLSTGTSQITNNFSLIFFDLFVKSYFMSQDLVTGKVIEWFVQFNYTQILTPLGIFLYYCIVSATCKNWIFLPTHAKLEQVLSFLSVKPYTSFSSSSLNSFAH